MPSRQFAHLRRKSFERLNALIPEGCPIMVRDAESGYTIVHRRGLVLLEVRRFQAAHAFVSGYVMGWKAEQADPRKTLTELLAQEGEDKD